MKCTLFEKLSGLHSKTRFDVLDKKVNSSCFYVAPRRVFVSNLIMDFSSDNELHNSLIQRLVIHR